MSLGSRVFAQLRCGLVIGPLVKVVPIAINARAGAHWHLNVPVNFCGVADAFWHFDGRIVVPEHLSAFGDLFDIVQMFEMDDGFDKLRVRLPNEEAGV